MNKNIPRISQNLDFRQSQQLIMTPQLQQAIKLLQLNNIELAEFVDEEIAQNPLLEKAEPEENSAAEETLATEETDNIQQEFDQANNSDSAADFDPGSSMASVGAGGSTSFDTLDDTYENRMSAEKTLREHLTEQLVIAVEDTLDRAIGTLLIDNIDEAGYLRADPATLAEQLGCRQERIEKLLVKMKHKINHLIKMIVF